MKRYEVVKDKKTFNNIINQGKKISNKYFIVFSEKKDTFKPNFGIAVGKKVGNAVIRNHLKRQMRSIIDANKILFKNYHNYIIMIKKESLNITYKEMNNNFISLLRKDNNEKN